MIPQKIRSNIWCYHSTSEYIHERIKSRVLGRYVYTHIHRTIIYNGQAVEATQVFIDRRMDKQMAIYTCSGILFRHKNGRNSDTRYKMDESWGHYAKQTNPVTRRQRVHDPTYLSYIAQANSWGQKGKWWLPGLERVQGMGSCLMDTEFQFWRMKRVLEIDGGDGYTTMWKSSMSLNWILKNGYKHFIHIYMLMLSRFSRIRLCATQ